MAGDGAGGGVKGVGRASRSSSGGGSSQRDANVHGIRAGIAGGSGRHGDDGGGVEGPGRRGGSAFGVTGGGRGNNNDAEDDDAENDDEEEEEDGGGDEPGGRGVDHLSPIFPLFSPERIESGGGGVIGSNSGGGGGGGRLSPSMGLTPSSLQLGLLNSVSPSMLLGPGAGAWLGATGGHGGGGGAGGGGGGTGAFGMSAAAPSFVQTSQLAPFLLSQIGPQGSFGESRSARLKVEIKGVRWLMTGNHLVFVFFQKEKVSLNRVNVAFSPRKLQPARGLFS